MCVWEREREKEKKRERGENLVYWYESKHKKQKKVSKINNNLEYFFFKLSLIFLCSLSHTKSVLCNFFPFYLPPSAYFKAYL